MISFFQKREIEKLENYQFAKTKKKQMKNQFWVL